MKYLPLIMLTSCLRTQIVYIDRPIEVNNINDIEIGIALQAECERLRRRTEDDWRFYSVEIYAERGMFLNEISIYFPEGKYPKDLEDCIKDLRF